MTNKEKLEALNYTWFYEPTCQEDVDKREAIIKELEKDLEILNIFKESYEKSSNVLNCKVLVINEGIQKIEEWLNERKR